MKQKRNEADTVHFWCGAARAAKVRKGMVGRGVVSSGPAWPGLARQDAQRFGVVRSAELRRSEVGYGFIKGVKAVVAATKVRNIGGEVPTNGAEEPINFSLPYVVNFTLEGISDMLFHRYNCESVEAKGKAAKGSKAKKTDDVESYVWRDADGQICIPGEYVRQSMIHAAKYMQDPRSPRKSAMDLYKAGIISLTQLASLGCEKCDYEDARRVVIQRSAITRIRPAMRAGWKADFQFMVNLPEYIGQHIFQQVLENAGRLVGLGDFRPSYGRFLVASLHVGLEE